MRWAALLTLVGCTLSVDDFDGDSYSVRDGDCDDRDATVHPAAADLEHDEIDQNCDGFDVLMRTQGEQHECELLDGGSVDCIGNNAYGQLEVPDHSVQFVEIAAGNNHTCALDELGSVVCWGDNRYGQCSPPFTVGFGGIDADANYSIGILADDESRALCWGLCRVQAP
jgi:alpha-tubulin suppressor-like RCC1 family protein